MMVLADIFGKTVIKDALLINLSFRPPPPSKEPLKATFLLDFRLRANCSIDRYYTDFTDLSQFLVDLKLA